MAATREVLCILIEELKENHFTLTRTESAIQRLEDEQKKQQAKQYLERIRFLAFPGETVVIPLEDVTKFCERYEIDDVDILRTFDRYLEGCNLDEPVNFADTLTYLNELVLNDQAVLATYLDHVFITRYKQHVEHWFSVKKKDMVQHCQFELMCMLQLALENPNFI